MEMMMTMMNCALVHFVLLSGGHRLFMGLQYDFHQPGCMLVLKDIRSGNWRNHGCSFCGVCQDVPFPTQRKIGPGERE